MKKVVGYLAVALVSFAAGGAAGWFARKKTSEVQFEVLDIQPDQIPVDENGKPDLEKVIESHFSVVKEEKPDVKKDDKTEDPAQQLDTQKEQYFKKWKAEEAMDKYDTRTKQDPEDPIVSGVEDLEEGLDPEFLDMVQEEEIDAKTRPDIEPGSMEDWEHWDSQDGDGEYDCVTVYWFTGDGVLTDEDGDPLENPGKFMGFNVASRFEEINEDTTGDPDIRIIYNHKYKTIYQVIRRRGSFARKKGMEEFGSDYRDEDDSEDDE